MRRTNRRGSRYFIECSFLTNLFFQSRGFFEQFDENVPNRTVLGYLYSIVHSGLMKIDSMSMTFVHKSPFWSLTWLGLMSMIVHLSVMIGEKSSL